MGTFKLTILMVFLITVIFGAESRLLSVCEDKGCSHDCLEKDGLPKCSCPSNMTLGSDKKTCQVPVPILLGLFRSISLYSEGSGDMQSIVPGKATAFDFHYNRKEIFAYINNTISRFNVEVKGKMSSPVLKTDTMVTSLAVDWVHDDLYWICQQKSAVEASSMNGTNHMVLVVHNDSSKTPHWHNIVVDPYARKLFWLGNSQLFTSDLTGAKLQTRLPSLKREFRPEDVTLDIRSQLVYVIGSLGAGGDKVVIRSKYDGSQGQELVNVGQAGSEVYGFGVLGKMLYWESSDDGENLYKCEIPKAGEKPKVLLVEELYQVVYDMKIFHPDVQKPLK